MTIVSRSTFIPVLMFLSLYMSFLLSHSSANWPCLACHDLWISVVPGSVTVSAVHFFHL